jgi:NhaA family Na+:H+ antiporter
MPEDLLPARSPSLPIDILTSPFVRFAKMEAAGGILLLAGTVAALVWANSSWEHSYHALWNAQLSIRFGQFSLSESRHEWVDDGLMSVFFFLVGLEIKREVLIGELSSLRQAAFPFIAALGGTIVPAVLYMFVSYGDSARRGWGIPMATDIAFALGVLALLGNRVPMSLKIFVTALAIVDDIIAVLIIAVFYTDRIQALSLVAAVAGIALCLGANVLGVRKPAIYGVIGICVWVAVLRSGVHATVAGFLLAITIPARTYVDRDLFLKRSHWLIHRFETASPNSFEAHSAIQTLEGQCELIESPLHRIEHYLQPWVSFLVMPMFAFANAGVRILGKVTTAAKHPVSLGIVLGLLIGKPIGIWFFAWMSAKLRLATPPAELSWGQILGAGWVCGIGFTMSLFIATLAFGDGALLDMSKIGILAASLSAGICGGIFLLRVADAKFHQS